MKRFIGSFILSLCMVTMSWAIPNSFVDWTVDQGAVNIHTGNVPDLSGTYWPVTTDLWTEAENTAAAYLNAAAADLLYSALGHNHSGVYEPVQTAASQIEAEVGLEAAIRSFSPVRIFQAIAAWITANITTDGGKIPQSLISGFGPTADPVFSMLDINAPGAEVADKDSGGLQSQYVDGAEDAENSDVWIYVMQGGSRVNFMHFDESDDQIKPLRDINSAYTIQGRAKFYSYDAAQTLTEAVHGGAVVMLTVADEITMWDCTANNIGSFVTLWPRDAEKIEVVPASGDQFYLLDGTGIGVDDELDMAAEAGKKVTLMCTAENEIRVFSEMAAATDGGAAD